MRLNITDELGFGFRLLKTNTGPFKGLLEVVYSGTNGDVTYGEWEELTTVTQWGGNGNYFGNGLMWWRLEEFSLVESSVPFQALMSYNHFTSPYGGGPSLDTGLFRENDQDFIFRVDTSEADTIKGNKYRDVVHAGGGDDTVSGMKGRDKLLGDAGHDHLNGGEGNDKLYGGRGGDVLSGGAGHDLVKGGAGDDTLYLSAGNDTLVGGNGSDTFVFSFSYNTVQGPVGRTVIRDFDVNQDLIYLGNLENIFYVERSHGLVIKGDAHNEAIKVLLLDVEQSDLTIDNYIL